MKHSFSEEPRTLYFGHQAEMHAEKCPNPACCNGSVEVRGSPFPALGLCQWCAGKGYIIEERR
jgi:hypothetical protein